MTATDRKIRVVVAKPGLDGHDRGAKIIARALRDAGMEVIYTGLHQTPEQIVETVIQEDADAVGLSILSGAHMTLVPRIMELLSSQGVDDVIVTVGGTIPADDIVAAQGARRRRGVHARCPGAGGDRLHPRRRPRVGRLERGGAPTNAGMPGRDEGWRITPTPPAEIAKLRGAPSRAQTTD